MRHQWTLISTSALVLATLSGHSDAQTSPPDSPSASGSAMYDPQQFPLIRGQVQQLTLTARGDIDGLILKDGTEVKTSPELAMQLTGFFKPGDRVTINGLHAAALPLIRAVSLTSEVTHRTVTESAVATPQPQPPASAPAPSVGSATELSGRVRMALHGPLGEVNGMLLDNGTILRIPPTQGPAVTAFMQARQTVSAQGLALTTAAGTVMEVQQIGPSHDKLVAVGPPAPPLGDPGSAGPGGRARPAPGGAPQPPMPPPAGAQQPGPPRLGVPAPVPPSLPPTPAPPQAG